MPTLLSLCGIPLPDDRTIDGKDLSPLLRGEQSSHLDDRELFWRFNGQKAMRKGRFKMMQNASESKAELYDLASDPAEAEDMEKENAGLLREMTEKWNRWEKDVLTGYPIVTG